MLKLDRVLNQERLLRAMTGLNRQAFNELLSQFADTYERTVFNSLANRKRAPGGGRKPTLRSIEEKLFYILLYCKCYPTFDLLSVLFNFDRSCAHDWVHRLLSVLETTLGEKQVLPARKLRSMEEFTKRFPDVKEVIVDGTERPVQRPQNRERQKEYYSGKKKRHTCKQITVSTREKRVIIRTKTRAGKVHDKRLLHESEIVQYIPDEVAIEGDLGFHGLEKEFGPFTTQETER